MCDVENRRPDPTQLWRAANSHSESPRDHTGPDACGAAGTPKAKENAVAAIKDKSNEGQVLAKGDRLCIRSITR